MYVGCFHFTFQTVRDQYVVDPPAYIPGASIGKVTPPGIVAIPLFEHTKGVHKTSVQKVMKDVSIVTGVRSNANNKRPNENRADLLAWFRDKKPNNPDIAAFQDVTAKDFGFRLAKWAGLVMAKEVSLGRSIGLYSQVYQPVLDAQVRGIEKAVPPVTVQIAKGKELQIDADGRYTGIAHHVSSRYEMFQEIKNAGYVIRLVADSYDLDRLIVDIEDDDGVNLLAVPMHDHQRYDLEPDATIMWQYRREPHTTLVIPGESPQSYNLGMQSGAQSFLRALGYDTSPPVPTAA